MISECLNLSLWERKVKKRKDVFWGDEKGLALWTVEVNASPHWKLWTWNHGIWGEEPRLTDFLNAEVQGDKPSYCAVESFYLPSSMKCTDDAGIGLSDWPQMNAFILEQRGQHPCFNSRKLEKWKKKRREKFLYAKEISHCWLEDGESQVSRSWE